MAYYDLHVHTRLSIGENTLEEMTEFAGRLGLAGIGIVQYYPGTISEIPGGAIKCVIIKPSSADELKGLAAKVREKAEVLMVHGGDYDVNRAACESSLIDVLCHPELGRRDSGLDHICAKAASANDVAIEINFREILESSKRDRIYTLSAMRKNIMLCSKYGAKMVTSSAAIDKFGLRSGRELAAMPHLLGLDLGAAIATTSDIPAAIVAKNREKLAGTRWQGVRIVE